MIAASKATGDLSVQVEALAEEHLAVASGFSVQVEAHTGQRLAADVSASCVEQMHTRVTLCAPVDGAGVHQAAVSQRQRWRHCPCQTR